MEDTLINTSFDVVPLHEHIEYIDECAELLDTYWKRSKAARLASLEKSCDRLPCSLLLLQIEDGKKRVIGHSRVNAAQGAENACYVESVVVRQDLRGRGYGKALMLESEKFAAKKGYKQMFLNTIDKMAFYEHIGYKPSHPVIILGANASKLPQSMIDELTKGCKTKCKTASPCDKNNCSSETPTISPQQADVPSAPTPPPLPSTTKTCKGTNACNQNVMDLCCDPSKVTWMKKDL